MRVETPKGYSILRAIENAIAFAKRERYNYVTFEFNDIEITVHADSNPNDIAYIYQLESTIRRKQRALERGY